MTGTQSMSFSDPTLRLAYGFAKNSLENQTPQSARRRVKQRRFEFFLIAYPHGTCNSETTSYTSEAKCSISDIEEPYRDLTHPEQDLGMLQQCVQAYVMLGVALVVYIHRLADFVMFCPVVGGCEVGFRRTSITRHWGRVGIGCIVYTVYSALYIYVLVSAESWSGTWTRGTNLVRWDERTGLGDRARVVDLQTSRGDGQIPERLSLRGW
ncbi:hypothetical protein FA13DRAFT_1715927 [Coprinellus micaceus]|uniref:Uncharacterized protein n=1 Tax=Coprinellus micaceus TaxID=71717 RepID=A0A4Y7SL92_COPMI|nr:hypothetical protein FA13DRAFT_1715927 [Coprinellus micaceus]